MKLKSFFTKKNKLLLVALIALVVLLVLVNAARTKVLTDAQIISNIAALTTIPDTATDAPIFAKLDMSQPQQPFTKGAKTGDIMVIFPISQRAIIYSPSDNRIVNQGPIVGDEASKEKAAVVSTETNISDNASTTTDTEN
jgi:hypothetical protein